MKCPMCEGTGKEFWVIDGVQEECQKCNGTGEIEQTNEEWLRTATTEELAQMLFNAITTSHDFAEYLMHYENQSEQDITNAIVRWLKEKHI